QPDIVEAGRGAVGGRSGYGDLELARQEQELGVQGEPLPDQLAPRTRIVDLVHGDAGEVIGGDVAHAVAAGLHGVHAVPGQGLQDVRGALDGRPVELDVLAGGEVAVAAVELARHPGEHAQLAGTQDAVRDGHAQHGRVKLKVQPVHEPKGAELVLVQA